MGGDRFIASCWRIAPICSISIKDSTWFGLVSTSWDCADAPSRIRDLLLTVFRAISVDAIIAWLSIQESLPHAPCSRPIQHISDGNSDRIESRSNGELHRHRFSQRSTTRGDASIRCVGGIESTMRDMEPPFILPFLVIFSFLRCVRCESIRN